MSTYYRLLYFVRFCAGSTPKTANKKKTKNVAKFPNHFPQLKFKDNLVWPIAVTEFPSRDKSVTIGICSVKSEMRELFTLLRASRLQCLSLALKRCYLTFHAGMRASLRTTWYLAWQQSVTMQIRTHTPIFHWVLQGFVAWYWRLFKHLVNYCSCRADS